MNKLDDVNLMYENIKKLLPFGPNSDLLEKDFNEMFNDQIIKDELIKKLMLTGVMIGAFCVTNPDSHFNKEYKHGLHT